MQIFTLPRERNELFSSMGSFDVQNQCFGGKSLPKGGYLCMDSFGRRNNPRYCREECVCQIRNLSIIKTTKVRIQSTPYEYKNKSTVLKK